MEEIWKDIPGYNGMYEVSSMGRVRSWKNARWGKRKKPKLLKLNNRAGYMCVQLMSGGQVVPERVHRLVAETFIKNYENKPCINHIDGNPSNNNKENLEWCTYSENLKHAYDNSLRGRGMAKITEKEVVKIIELYGSGEFYQKEIAAMFDIGQDQVSRIINRKSWNHLHTL